MTSNAIEQRRDALIEEFGAWTVNNIHLGHGIYTMGAELAGMAEDRIVRTVALIEDFAKNPVEELRILDLGAYEGGFAVQLAQLGAEVVALEGRERHAAKIRFAVEALGLDRLTVVHEDVRSLPDLNLGSFDVVLCLGLLYHLRAKEVVDLVGQLARQTTGFAIIETQVGLNARVEHVASSGARYWGLTYAEDTRHGPASIENDESFWPTKPSLFNILTDSGFRSVCECRTPFLPDVAAYVDHVTLIAAPGTAGNDGAARWPEDLDRTAHPAQGPTYRLRDRVRRLHGGGLTKVFAKREAS